MPNSLPWSLDHVCQQNMQYKVRNMCSIGAKACIFTFWDFWMRTMHVPDAGNGWNGAQFGSRASWCPRTEWSKSVQFSRHYCNKASNTGRFCASVSFKAWYWSQLASTAIYAVWQVDNWILTAPTDALNRLISGRSDFNSILCVENRRLNNWMCACEDHMLLWSRSTLANSSRCSSREFKPRRASLETSAAEFGARTECLTDLSWISLVSACKLKWTSTLPGDSIYDKSHSPSEFKSIS